MKNASKKTKRDFSPVQQQTENENPKTTPLAEYEGFKVGDKVWFNISLVAEKYVCGTVREILHQSCGKVVLGVWDDAKGMWRSFGADKLLTEKPVKERKRRSKL